MIVEILNEKSIKLPLEGRAKNEIIEELIDLAVASGVVEDRDALLQATLERESMMSTGIGKGVAIPHGKAKGVKGLCASLGIADRDIDFQALDGEPVRIFFFLASPPDVISPHVRALARISRLLNRDSFREGLLEAKTVQDVLELFRASESDM